MLSSKPASALLPDHVTTSPPQTSVLSCSALPSCSTAPGMSLDCSTADGHVHKLCLSQSFACQLRGLSSKPGSKARQYAVCHS